MLAVALLVALIAGLAWVAPRALVGARWARRSPAWGIVAWQALVVALPGALLALGVTLALPLAAPARAVAEVIGAPPEVVATHYATPGGVVASVTACLAALALLTRIALVGVSRVAHLRAVRASHRDRLSRVTTRRSGGYALVQHSTALVYCVPGRPGTVVVTTEARRLLGRHGLDLVLQHERAHLRWRHALLLAWTDVMARAVPITAVATARDEMTVLVEMQADDATTDPRGLARALVSLGCGTPLETLGAGEVATVDRVRRLVGQRSRTRVDRLAVAGAAVTAVLLMAAPPVLAAAPLIEMLVTDCATAPGVV